MTIPGGSDNIAAEELERRKRLRLLDQAYGCFAFLGFSNLPFGLVTLLELFGLLNLNDRSGVGATLAGWAELFEYTLAIPLFVAMLTASVYGIRRTVQHPDPALVVLSGISIVCEGTFISLLFKEWNVGSNVVGDMLEIGYGIFIAANIILPARWLIVRRRRCIVGQT
jgi:hypothetical protein